MITNTVKTDMYEKAELGLLYYMLNYKEVVKIFENKKIYFPTKEYRSLYNEIKCFIDEYNYINMSDFTSYMDESLSSTLGLVISQRLPEEYNSDIISDFIKVIKEKNITDQCNRLNSELEKCTDLNEKAIIGQKIIDVIKIKNED